MGTIAGIRLGFGDHFDHTHHSHVAFAFMGGITLLCLAMGGLAAMQRRLQDHALWMSRLFGVFFFSSQVFRILIFTTLWAVKDMWWWGAIYTFYAWTTPILGFVFGSMWAPKGADIWGTPSAKSQLKKEEKTTDGSRNERPHSD